ncbi:cytochrome P450 4c21-like isoform X2 [Schistocerca cancellata]|uniref:cytochrome P450 4c21-like isoform X2 n=1 Tax=Schistocerca cancellata TaxID=274614 RepID=UPI002118C681|nr:cytochrome P450 4c21-like isoform X2 [Schistocerca cancellata]
MAWWPWLMVQLVVSCCAGLVAVLWWKWATKPHIDAPGPPTLPIIGNILDLLHLPLTLRKMFELHRQYGDLTRLYVGPMLLVLVAHPDDVQHILLTSKLVDRGTICTNAMRMFLGDGLVTIDASRWKVHRKLINPTFHSEILQGFLDAFHDGGLFVCERFARTRGAATEVHPPVLLAAIRNFFSTVIGMNPELFIADTFPEEEVSASVSYGVSIVQKMIFRPWMQSKFLLQLTSKGRGLLRSAKMLHNRALKCIAIRSAATEDGPTKTRQRLLEALIKPGGQTAIPLDEVQGEETLRLFPTVPMLPRVATEDIWLSGGSAERVSVPKGTLLFVLPFLTHRLPQFFQDPQRFDPSRFLEDRVGKEHACSYLPFGLGARNCVGSQYGRLQLKVYLADILRRFRFLPCGRREDLEDSALSFSLSPIKPVRVSCVPVDGPKA